MRASVLALGLIVLFGGAAPTAAARPPVTVFAAASLTGVLTDIEGLARRQGLPGCRCVFAASSALARQIANGAPADIFISANRRWVDYAVDNSPLDTATRRVIAGNRLVLIAPADRPLTLPGGDWAALPARLAGGWLAIADPAHVPAGLYGAAALRHLGLWDALAPRLAIAANVRTALALVDRGEAAAGIVYGTDVQAAARVVEIAAFPDTSHPPIEYLAVLHRAPVAPDAEAYFALLLSSAAQARFAAFGFQPGSGR